MISLLSAATGCVCTAAAAPWPVDGVWIAVSDNQPGHLSLALSVQDGRVTGQVRKAAGALPITTAAASGTWKPPVLHLSWAGADGHAWQMTGIVVDKEKMKATLAWPGGTLQELHFVRP
jgi:hypothetical protein